MGGLLEAAAGVPPRTRVLPEVAVALATSARMHRATVLLFGHLDDLVTGTTRLADGSLDAPLWAALRAGHPGMPAVAAARRGAAPVVFTSPDTATDLGDFDWVARFGARTVAVTPLVTRRRVVGVAVLDDPQRGAMTEGGLAGLVVASRTAAAVLEMLEAVEAERVARTRSDQVIETAAATARSMSASAALTAVAEGLRVLCGDSVVIARAQTPAGDRTEVCGDTGGVTAAVEAFIAAGATEGLVGVSSIDVTAPPWERFGEQGYMRGLIVPLRHRSSDIGWVLSLGHSPSRYTADERNAALVVGEQASLALHMTSLLEEERATVDRLTGLDRLKNTFLAAVSHELRTPLTAIVGFSDLLAEEIDDPDLTSYLDDLRRESAVLEALIGNLLDTSRLEAGMLRLNVRPVDLAAMVRQAIDVVKHGQPDREIEFVVGERTRPLLADGVRLRQVFINLIENAVKYSPATAPVCVTIGDGGIDSGRSRIEVTIDDGGAGIPEQAREAIFERFVRLPEHERHSGTGIGLYVVKALVEAHGGRVVIEEPPDGNGTRFRVVLPVEADPA
ncbi:MAG: sensor histidine kinase [Acidimicrobiia bacterium]